MVRNARRKKAEEPAPPPAADAPPAEQPVAPPAPPPAPEDLVVLTDDERGALRSMVQILFKFRDELKPLSDKIDLERLAKYGKHHPHSGMVLLFGFRVEHAILKELGLGDGEHDMGAFGISVAGIDDPKKIPSIIPPDYPTPVAVAAVQLVIRSIVEQAGLAAADMLTDIILFTAEELKPVRGLLARLNQQAGAFFGQLMEKKQAEALEKLHREKGEAPS